LGWIGKNNLLTQKLGLLFYCRTHHWFRFRLWLCCDGSLWLYCLHRCLSQAIVGPYVVDGSKCISYFTIELKRIFRKRWKEVWGLGVWLWHLSRRLSWNKFSKPHNEPLFNNIDVLSMTRKTGTKSPKKLLGWYSKILLKKNKIWRFET
jgi:epoxyqueuosine reductase